jgi:hypothetical protein
LSEITFRSAAAAPPITLSSPKKTATPAPTLLSLSLGVAPKPMKLPATLLPPSPSSVMPFLSES